MRELVGLALVGTLASRAMTRASLLVLFCAAACVSEPPIDDEPRAGGSIRIVDNANLTSLQALGGLSVAINRLTIEDNPELRSLAGLGGVSEVTGDVTLWDNGLRSLEGLGGISRIGGRLWIVGNNALVALDGLSALTHLGYWSVDLVISSNGNLRDVSGLMNVEEFVGGLLVNANPRLCVSDVEALIAALGLDLASAGQGNDPGC